MPLAGFKSRCLEHARIVVSVDDGNSQTHIANNPRQYYVTHYKIDGEVITQGARCDFLLINEDMKALYFIELKGSDICKAAAQIDATEKALSEQLASYPHHFYRIVANRVNTHALKSSAYRKYQIRWGKNLQQKVKKMTEEL